MDMNKKQVLDLLMDFYTEFTIENISIDDWEWWTEKWIDKKFPIDK